MASKIAMVAVLATLSLSGCAGSGGLFSGGENPQVKEQQADQAMAAGDTRAAAELYGQIVSSNPNYIPARVKLGNALLAMGMANEAMPHFQAAVNAEPSNREAVRGAGRCLVQMGNGEAAIPYFEQLVAMDPSPASYASLGVGYDLAGRFQEAQANYRQGLRMDPNHNGLRNNMGLSLLLSGNPDGAISVLQSVANSPSATAQHRGNLALAYGVLGKENAAQRMLEKDLNSADVARNLAIYQKIRGLNGQSLREAVLLGDAGGRERAQ